MAFTVAPRQRRLAMGAMLALAVAGAVLRSVADNPSTLRDVGTLLLVMWLPAVGNLIGWLAGKLPRAAPPPTDFASDAFAPQLRAEMTPLPAAPDILGALGADGRRCTLVLGRRGFTARARQPLLQWLGAGQAATLELEFLSPGLALAALPAGTRFHVVVGTTGIGTGCSLGAPQADGDGELPARRSPTN